MKKSRHPSFKIGECSVGADNPCFIIAEVAQAHDGSLGTAHAFIDAIAKTGANAVKFQTHIASAESTPSEAWRVKFSLQDKTRYEYWKRMEFTEEQWAGLKKHACDRNLQFLSSPFSVEAVELLDRLRVPAWKIASGESNNPILFQSMAASRLPFLVSTGMSTIGEIDDLVNKIIERDIPFAVLQCTSAYPCPPEKIGINMIPFFKDRYGGPVGLSDHSGVIFAGIAATVLGMNILEVHVTLSREMFGPDVCASVTSQELKTLVEGVRFCERMMKSPTDKDSMACELENLRNLFTKSVVARSDIPAGTILTLEHLTVKKPGTGIPAARIGELVGMKARRFIHADELLNPGDLVGKETVS
jgi:N,N'-diacetyllegionaminate synthase